MDWSAIAAFAELVAAIGVIISLLYLAVQVRHATRMGQAATRQALADGVVRLASDLVELDDMARLMQAHIDGAPLTAHESLRLHSRAFRDLRFWDNAYYQYSQGLLTQEDWASFRANLAAIFQLPAYREFWASQEPIFTKAFAAEVNALLDEAGPFDFLDTYSSARSSASGSDDTAA